VTTFSLQSGSNGNSIYVEAEGVRLLFDAGLCGKDADARMKEHGRDIRAVDALIISHEHLDHANCAGTWQRLFGLPIYVTRKTLDAVPRSLGKLRDVRFFERGDVLEFGPVRVYTIPTPHDAVDGSAFVVECAGKRLGILTDLGHPFTALPQVLETLDAAYLESNYDPDMLERGWYPPEVKARIRGKGGHLSNLEAAELVARLGLFRPKWVAVAHLSANNNCPDLALDAHRVATGRDYPVHLAGREGVSICLQV
jgi:phosphoribosyl 1,2-cyclic phosphodiesterase